LFYNTLKFCYFSLFLDQVLPLFIVYLTVYRLSTGLTVRGSNPGRCKRLSLPQNLPDRLWCTASLLFIEYRGSVPRAERPRREVDHWPPASAEVRYEWSYTSASPIWFSWYEQGRLYSFVYL